MSESSNTNVSNKNNKDGKKGGGRNRNRNRGRRGPNNNKNNNGNEQCREIPKKPPPITEEKEVDAPDHHYCLICCSHTLHEERGITPCGHDDVCASCHLRLRSLLSDKRCPICKADNEQIIIDTDPVPEVDEHKSFDQYEKWGDDIGPKHTYREDVGMFFPTTYYHTKVTPLFALTCNVAKCKFANDSSESNSPGTLKALKNHLATAHNPPLQICDLCITHKRDFISRLPRFTANQLKEHNKYGDVGRRNVGSAAGKANKGHPPCNFCQTRFYDLTELHKHLHKEHYECFVCKKLEKPLQFFKDYNKLNLHFDREHYLCRFPECLAARFVVFPNEIDLKAHERDVHGLSSGGSTKIQMEFRVRPSGRDGSGLALQQQQVPNMEEDFGFGLDGEVFVPASLDDTLHSEDRQTNEPEITHGPHAERTALLREQARIRREEMGITGTNQGGITTTDEAFPTLGSSGGGNMISWAREGETSAVNAIRGRNTTELNDQNFPTLGGPSAPKSKKVAKIQATRRGVNSQFSAMNLAANATSTSRPFANAAGTLGSQRSHTDAQLSADNFPSLGPAVASNNRYASANAAAKKINARSNLTSNNFPSLGSATTSTNKYAAVNALAKKNAAKSSGMNLNLDQHFPAPSLSNATKIPTKKKNVFEKKPAASIATDNFLAFPAAPSAKVNDAGRDQVEGMKRALGQAKYKQLKKFTKQFAATNELDPESYVSSVVSLFDDGIKDPTLWEFIPGLISSCPNVSNTKRAMRYLENMRFSSGQSPLNQPTGTTRRKESSTSWNSGAPSISASFSSGGSASSKLQYGSAAARAPAQAPSISARQNISTGYNSRSLPVSQVKKKNSWNGNHSRAVAVAASKAGSALAVAAAAGPQNGTATKFMAKEKAKEKKAKQVESMVKQGTNEKKKKAKAKKNELRALAFGL